MTDRVKSILSRLLAQDATDHANHRVDEAIAASEKARREALVESFKLVDLTKLHKRK